MEESFTVLQHWSTLLKFAKNSQEVLVTERLIRECTLGSLEASALGGR